MLKVTQIRRIGGDIEEVYIWQCGNGCEVRLKHLEVDHLINIIAQQQRRKRSLEEVHDSYTRGSKLLRLKGNIAATDFIIDTMVAELESREEEA